MNEEHINPHPLFCSETAYLALKVILLMMDGVDLLIKVTSFLQWEA